MKQAETFLWNVEACDFRQYLASGAYLFSVQQWSANIHEAHLPWNHFSIAISSWWNLSLCLSLTLQRFSGKKSKCDSRKWIFRLILHHIALYEVNRSWTTSWYLASLWFPKKSLQILLNDNHAFVAVSFRSSLNLLSCISSLIWGSYKYTLLDFWVTHIWELIPHISESIAVFIHTLHKVFHEALLHVQWVQINFFQKNKRRIDDIFLPWHQWYLFRPQFIYIVILLVPGVPLTQETAVIFVLKLHSK